MYLKCNEGNFEASNNTELCWHQSKKHGWPQNRDNLDMSEGPRYCNKCDYQAEDEYDLDAHTWSEHDDDDEEIEECSLEINRYSFGCNICEENFDTKRDLMNHKKKQHYDRVEMCWRFANCSYADTDCWFRHYQTAQVTESSTVNCNLCDKELLQPNFNPKTKLV